MPGRYWTFSSILRGSALRGVRRNTLTAYIIFLLGPRVAYREAYVRSYRSYFLDRQGQIRQEADIDASCDALAVCEALLLLEQTPDSLQMAEIWDSTNKIAQVPRLRMTFTPGRGAKRSGPQIKKSTRPLRLRRSQCPRGKAPLDFDSTSENQI